MNRTAVPSKTPSKIRTLIVDDEPLARDKVRMLLARDGDIEIVGECADGEEAIEAIRKKNPDLLFLDIQMPGPDGFEVLKAVGVERIGAVVFVTAYDQHALRAFEVHALDYLLKPFANKRFKETLQRAKEHLARSHNGLLTDQLQSLLSDLNGGREHLERLVIRSAGRVFFVKVDEIDWIEASGNYVTLHVGRNTHLLRQTMNGIEEQLDKQKFVRIHRSTLVNIERIKELSPLFHGDYVVTLHDGTRLTLSRNYRENLTLILKGEI
jgi:two-component system LytT family response regulator